MTSRAGHGAAVALLAVGVAAAPAAAQRQVTLRVRPPIGDTLYVELDQRFDMEPMGRTRTPAMTGELRVWSHTVALRRTGTSTDVLSVTDSVLVTPPSAAMLRPLQAAKHALEGRTVRLRIAENGELLVGGTDSGSAGTQLPAVLPYGPVHVGDSWTRDLRVPLSTTGTSTALVRTRFRFDSLGHDGAVAFVSMHGDVSHNHAEDAGDATGQTTGTLTGTMQLDRRLSWVTDSRMRLLLTSDVAAPGRAITHRRMLITQVLRTSLGG